MPCATRMPKDLTPIHARRLTKGSQREFYLIYFSSLFCLMATGCAATLFL